MLRRPDIRVEIALWTGRLGDGRPVAPPPLPGPAPRADGPGAEPAPAGRAGKGGNPAPSETQSASRWGNSPEDIRNAQVSTAACWHRPGVPQPLHSEDQRRAWAVSRVDQRRSADPHLCGTSLKAARESGILPKYILPLGVVPLPPTGAAAPHWCHVPQCPAW